MVHKHTKIPIVVTDNRSESPCYRSIVFARPRNFTFDSGDWIDITFAGQTLKGGKTYSLASSPTEPDLLISFKDGVSECKRALAALKPGDVLTITQYGNDYSFTLHPHRTSMLIAGGVGIAPFRSMLREMIDTRDSNKVSLVYLNQTPDFLFLDELQRWQRELPGLHITYLVTQDMKKKDKTNALLATLQSTEQNFYIAGPEGMVESTEHILIDYGVPVDRIKIDSFGGY